MATAAGAAGDEEASAWRRRALSFGGGLLATGALVACAPITAGVGLAAAAGATTFARSRMLSLEPAFHEALDRLLRSRAAAGHEVRLIQRFSKRIDQLYSDFGCTLGPRNDADSHQLRSRQDLPILRHSGIVLKLVSSDGLRTWIKIEFVKEGLKFELHEDAPPLPSSYLIEDCNVRGISPLAIADSLFASKAITYNALTWNCNHVADMLWDVVRDAALMDGGGEARSGDLRTAPAAPHSQGRGCKICFEREKDTRFAPCGHYCTCQQCAGLLDLCPVCTCPIQEKQRVYDS